MSRRLTAPPTALLASRGCSRCHRWTSLSGPLQRSLRSSFPSTLPLLLSITPRSFLLPTRSFSTVNSVAPPPPIPPLLPSLSPPLSPPSSVPFKPPSSPAAFLSQLREFNRRADYTRARDLFLRCRSFFPLTEEVADEALQAMSHLSIDQSFHAFTLYLHQGVATTPRLFNRMLSVLLTEGERETEEGAGEGESVTVEGAERLLQTLTTCGISANAETRYLLTRIHLTQGRVDAAYAHCQHLSALLSPPPPSTPTPSPVPPPPVSAGQLLDLFRLFRDSSSLSGCSLVLSDMRRLGLRLRPWMQATVDSMQQKRQQSPAKRGPPKSRGTLPSIAPSPSISSPSTFRVGLTRPTPSPLPDVLQALDTVDPYPPSVPHTLGPHFSSLQSLLTPLPPWNPGEDPLADPLLPTVEVLIDCFHSGDAERVLQFSRNPGTVDLTPPLLNLMLCTLCTANFPRLSATLSSSPSTPPLPPPSRLHHQLGDALGLVERMRTMGADLHLCTAILLLRALAYLPLPLPTSRSPLPLSAEVVATATADLFTYTRTLLSPSDPVLSLLHSLTLRAHCKSPSAGARAVLTLTGSDSPLTPEALTSLLYHHVHLPVTSLQEPYHLFTLLPSPPPPLSLYFLLCGELLRGHRSKAHAIYHAGALRYGYTPPSYMTDALILSHRGLERGDEEDKTAATLYEVLQGLKGREGGQKVEVGREAVELWVEMRVRRRMKETRGVPKEERSLRFAQDTAMAEAFWPSLLPPSSPPSFSALLHFAVLLGSSPLLPAVLSFISSTLRSLPYVLIWSSESAITSAIDVEWQLYLLSCQFTRTDGGEVESPAFSQFTQFSHALALLPLPAHAAFLHHHLLSRVVRCVAYTLPLTGTCGRGVGALEEVIREHDLDVDVYSYHILLAAAASLEPSLSPALYDRGVQAWDRLHQQADAAEMRFGFCPPAYSHTLQHLHLLLVSSPHSSLPPRLQTSLRSEFFDDAVVLGLIDIALSRDWPHLLVLAMNALVVTTVPHTPHPAWPTARDHENSPLPRSYSALTLGWRVAVRGMAYRHWVETATLTTPLYSSASSYIQRYYGHAGGLIAPSPSTSSPFVLWQRELLSSLAFLAVETNNFGPLWTLYGLLTPQHHSLGWVFGVVLKAALLNGHTKHTRTVLSAMKDRKWGEEERKEVEAAVKGVQFPLLRMQDSPLTLPAILSHYLRRVKLFPHKPRPPVGEAPSPPPAPLTWEAQPALQASLWAFGQLFETVRKQMKEEGVVLLCGLFHELYHRHVRAERQREGWRRAREGLGEKEKPANVEVVRIAERLCDWAALSLSRTSTPSSHRPKAKAAKDPSPHLRAQLGRWKTKARNASSPTPTPIHDDSRALNVAAHAMTK